MNCGGSHGHLLLGDGSVQYIGSQMDLGVYDALASRAGGDMNTGTFAD
jgi:hypothetical protein